MIQIPSRICKVKKVIIKFFIKKNKNTYEERVSSDSYEVEFKKITIFMTFFYCKIASN